MGFVSAMGVALVTKILILVVLVIGSIGAILGLRSYLNRRTQEVIREADSAMDRNLARDVPLRSDELHIMQYLEDHKMSHGEVEFLRGEESQHHAGAAALITAASGEKVIAPLLTCSFQLEFRFDSTGRMVSYEKKLPCIETSLGFFFLK